MQETVKDASGNIYNVITIDGKKWMAENLKTTKLNNGTALQYFNRDDFEQASGFYDMYGYYGDDAANLIKYGALYVKEAVAKGGICPEGWHVANNADWTSLKDFIGEGADALLKLKTTTGWQDDYENDIAGLDTYGFAAKAGGNRETEIDGIDHDYTDWGLHNWTCWWTGNGADYAILTKDKFVIQNDQDDENSQILGAYIRCVKD